MTTNYGQAALRHWNSSRALAADGHLQDAAYLAGYVGECGLKAVIVALGGTGDPKSYAHDLEALIGDALATAALFTRGAGRYEALARPIALLNWSPEQRYEANRTDMASLQSICVQAGEVGTSLIFALALDGLLEEVLW
jgi:hypothetical protein